MTLDEELQIIITKDFEMNSFAKGTEKLIWCLVNHHVYKEIWTPETGEKLSTEWAPGNAEDKYPVYVKKKKKIKSLSICHLEKLENLQKLCFTFWGQISMVTAKL